MDFSAFMEGIFFFCPEPYFYYDRTWAESLFLCSGNPNLFFSILFCVLFLAGLFYMITAMGGLGAEHDSDH
jgi:hypothetical protein